MTQNIFQSGLTYQEELLSLICRKNFQQKYPGCRVKYRGLHLTTNWGIRRGSSVFQDVYDIAALHDLKDVLTSTKRNFAFTYALGFGGTETAIPLIESALKDFEDAGLTYKAIVTQIEAIEIYTTAGQYEKAFELSSKPIASIEKYQYKSLLIEAFVKHAYLSKISGNKTSFHMYLRKSQEVAFSEPRLETQVNSFREVIADALIYIGQKHAGIKILNYLLKKLKKNGDLQEAERLRKKLKRIEKLF